MKQTKSEGIQDSTTVAGSFMGVPIEEITEALRESAHAAWRCHKALSLPIVIRRDGKVVEVPPEEIEV